MYVARDKDGILGIYINKPVKAIDSWSPLTANEDYCVIKTDLFPEVKWSDEEPRELVLKPINEEQS